MAEFLEQKTPKRATGFEPDQGFGAMGKPVPWSRRSAALRHCRDMGVANTEDACACIDAMAQQIERDQPYEAMAAGMRHLDLVGTYRLIAVLCCEEVQDPEPSP